MNEEIVKFEESVGVGGRDASRRFTSYAPHACLANFIN